MAEEKMAADSAPKNSAWQDLLSLLPKDFEKSQQDFPEILAALANLDF